MTAVTADLYTKRKQGSKVQIDVAASTTLYTGTLICRDGSGNAVNAAINSAYSFAGVADEAVDNSTGSAGDKEIRCWDDGLFRLALEGGSAAQGDIGKKVYVHDNATVATADALGGDEAFVYVGTIRELDEDNAGYVWVEIDPQGSPGPQADGKSVFSVRVAGVNATAFDLSTAAAAYGGSDFYVDSMIGAVSYLTADGTLVDGLLVVTTDWTLADGVLTTVNDETNNTWDITFLGRLVD